MRDTQLRPSAATAATAASSAILWPALVVLAGAVMSSIAAGARPSVS